MQGQIQVVVLGIMILRSLLLVEHKLVKERKHCTFARQCMLQLGITKPDAGPSNLILLPILEVHST